MPRLSFARACERKHETHLHLFPIQHGSGEILNRPDA
jgi:hypothetical protein